MFRILYFITCIAIMDSSSGGGGRKEGGSVAQVYAIISNFEVYLYAIYVYYTSWGGSEGGIVTAQRCAV